MLKDAWLSACGVWRWSLTRRWSDAPMLVVCMLNPSTANHLIDDPTIKELTKRAKTWGYGGIWVINLNAFRSPHPSVLMQQDECTREGPLNYQAWDDALRYAKASTSRPKVLAAWGNGGSPGRFEFWCDLHEIDLYCLGTTQSGAPKHPLARGVHRIPADQPLTLWRAHCGF